MKNQRGIVDMVLILILTAAVLGGAAVVFFNAKNKSQTQEPSIQPVPISPAADPTANWKTFTSVQGGFSFKYNPAWKTNTCNGTDTTVYLGPSTEALALCSSDFTGQMIVGVLEGGQTIENSTNSNEGDYDGYKKEPVTIDGATGVRAVGKLKAESEVGPPAGTYMINYALKKGDKVYLALYYQYPSGPVSQNLQGDFELMVKSLKFK